MLIKNQRRRKKFVQAGRKISRLGTDWYLAYYGRGNSTNGAQTTFYRDLLCKNSPIKSFTLDPANNPVVQRDQHNTFTHALVLCWNPTWVSNYGEYFIIPLYELNFVTRSSVGVDVISPIPNKKVWNPRAGWPTQDPNSNYSKDSVVGFWDTGGLSPTGGGEAVCASMTQMILANTVTYGCHYDGNAVFQIYLGNM